MFLSLYQVIPLSRGTEGVSILKNQIYLIRAPLLQHLFAVQDDSHGSYRKAVVGKVVRDARMILDIPRHILLVPFKEGRIVQRVTNKQLLEHPEQPLWPLSFTIKRTFDLASINFVRRPVSRQ